MFNFLIAAGVALAGQIGGVGDRYPPPLATGQGVATIANSNGAVNGAEQVHSATAPAGNGTSHESGTSPDNIFQNNRSQPSGFGGKQTAPLHDSSRAPVQQPSGLSFDESAAAKQQTGVKPSAMMQAMLTPPTGSQLRGEPVRLIDVIGTGRTRNDQTQRVDAYWDLCSSVADYYLGLREQDEFRKLGTYVSRPGAAWQEAEKELAVRIDTSLRAARASQFRLASFIGRGPNNMPLPADMPHCGTYTSNYDHIFAGRSSPEAHDLAQLLPLRYAELKDAAAGVTRAEDALDGSVRNENSDGASGIQAFELLALRRRAFVQIARDYNRRIARYAELAMPGQLGAERLTDMLIIRPGSSTATRSSSPAPPPKRQSSNGETSPPRTFVNEWSPTSNGQTQRPAKRDETVHPASATQSETRTEHSLIVPPR
jgi:hypothetical protein